MWMSFPGMELWIMHVLSSLIPSSFASAHPDAQMRCDDQMFWGSSSQNTCFDALRCAVMCVLHPDAQMWCDDQMIWGSPSETTCSDAMIIIISTLRDWWKAFHRIIINQHQSSWIIKVVLIIGAFELSSYHQKSSEICIRKC